MRVSPLKPLKKILITAGPTREMLDPVRFLSNLSTGEMGYTLARIAKKQGYSVTLISGPTALKPPAGILFVPVISAAQMQKACQKHFPKNDALVMTAAVCDFTAAKPSAQKIRRTKTNHFLLKQTPDILAGLAKSKKGKIVIGFCLETENWIQNAIGKLTRKKLDGIVANYYTKRHIPFGDKRIHTAFVGNGRHITHLKNVNKGEVSKRLLLWLEALQSRKAVKKQS